MPVDQTSETKCAVYDIGRSGRLNLGQMRQRTIDGVIVGIDHYRRTTFKVNVFLPKVGNVVLGSEPLEKEVALEFGSVIDEKMIDLYGKIVVLLL